MSVNGLRSYPAYRESGAGWLGPVPEHWKVRRIKFLLRERHARSGSGKEQLLRVSQYTGITKRHRKDTRAESLIGYKRVAQSDLVVNIMLAWNGSLGVSPFDGIVSPAYCVYRFGANTEPRYAHYLLRSPLYRARIKTVSTGVVESRLRLYTDDFYRLEAVLPPVSEQRAIVRFLDHADQCIRRYIRAKEKLIALLEEQKQAIIHQAVTGQIDVRTGQPYPAYKDSGVEWLREVPEHWDVSRFGRLVNLVVGFPFQSQGFTESRDGIRLLRGINIAPGELRWHEVVRWPVSDSECLAEYRMQVGDIVVGMDRPIVGSGTRVATVSLNDVPALLLQRVARIRVGNSLARDFAVALLRGKGFMNYLAPIFTGISVPHLSPGQIKDFRVAVPDLVEQRAIIKHVKSRTEAVQSAIAGVSKQIRLLREYRTRLVADVVTGKLDVREAVASLSEADPHVTNEPRDEGGAYFEGRRHEADLAPRSVHP